MKVLSVNGLMNFFSWKEIASKFVDTVIEPVLDLLRETGCVEAANCIFNLMRFDNCELKLITLNVHVTLLDIMCAMNAKMSDAKSACLRALCRFSSNEQCIFAWLDADLIPRLSDQIALTDKSTWLDISKMILASTSSIYGNSGEKEMVEGIDEKINPPSIYASTKLSGETLAVLVPCF